MQNQNYYVQHAPHTEAPLGDPVPDVHGVQTDLPAVHLADRTAHDKTQAATVTVIKCSLTFVPSQPTATIVPVAAMEFAAQLEQIVALGDDEKVPAADIH
jgi:hypothetical protein